MFPFRKTSLLSLDFFQGFTDHHCHILPGVDDGVKTMEETLDILSLYETWGVKSVWMTPHIMEEVPNEPSKLQARFEEVKSAYKGNIELHLAAENMLDGLFEQRLKEENLLYLGKEKSHLLVETSYFTPPMDLYGTLRKIMAKGIFPILAHPERYVYMEEDDYDTLKEMQVRFQLNIGSVCGMYGKEVKAKAERLLKLDMYDLLGSDTHSISFIRYASTAKISCDKKKLLALRENQF